MRMKYLHEKTMPILPAVGDIRFFAELSFSHDESKPIGKISVIRCSKLLEHHAVYEFLEENHKSSVAVPFEVVQNWGFQSIDDAVLSILDAYEKTLRKNLKKTESEIFRTSENLTEYYKKLSFLVTLSRQMLKEADKAKKTYQNFLEKEKVR